MVLGLNQQLRNRLRKHGKSATAEVLDFKQRPWSVTDGGGEGIVGATKYAYRLKLRVTPDGEAPFDAEITDQWEQFSEPSIGMTVPVLYDPEHHSRVVLDAEWSDSKRVGLRQRWASEEQAAGSNPDDARLESPDDDAASDQRIEDWVDAKERRSVEQGMDPGDAASLADLKRAAISDPAAFRKQMFDLREQMTGGGPAATGAGGLAGIMGAFGGGSGQPGGADTVDQLQKLADLHDRGVLTDEEFAAAKAKLLDES